MGSAQSFAGVLLRGRMKDSKSHESCWVGEESLVWEWRGAESILRCFV